MKNIRFNINWISKELLNKGRQIIYLNDALYPVLNIQVRLREHSREQMGDIEITVLKLCSIGVVNLDKMSFAMGIAPQRLDPIVREIIGRGLIAVDDKDDAFYLTELGKLSLQHGKEVIEIDRSVLLCGITGRLLPRRIYSMNRKKIQELKERKSYIPDLIQESVKIPLQALDLSSITSKKEVNLPDETISIEGMIEGSAEPNFINTVIAISKDSDGSLKNELYYNGGLIDWLDKKQILGMLEPLGFPEMSPKDAVEKIICRFAELGATVSSVQMDTFNNVQIKLGCGSESLFELKYSGQSIAFCIGGGAYPALPIGSFKINVDKNNRMRTINVLNGHTLTIKATPDSELARQISILRYIDEQIRLYKQGKLSMSTTMTEYIHKSLDEKNINLSKANQIAKLVGQESIIKALQSTELES
ncbi:MAG: hypothetical protein KBA28_11155 [Syntrophaceae bacterium]|nr:hypothetical protein [Syntrophaceae bacterium]